MLARIYCTSFSTSIANTINQTKPHISSLLHVKHMWEKWTERFKCISFKTNNFVCIQHFRNLKSQYGLVVLKIISYNVTPVKHSTSSQSILQITWWGAKMKNGLCVVGTSMAVSYMPYLESSNDEECYLRRPRDAWGPGRQWSFWQGWSLTSDWSDSSPRGSLCPTPEKETERGPGINTVQYRKVILKHCIECRQGEN